MMTILSSSKKIGCFKTRKPTERTTRERRKGMIVLKGLVYVWMMVPSSAQMMR